MTRPLALVRAALSAALDEDPGPLTLAPVGGGSINEAALVRNGEGGEWFLKWNDHPLPRQFEAEAAGLRSLASAETDLTIPDVISSSDVPGEAFLLLQYLEPGRRRPTFDEDLGRALAALHRTSSPRGFGFELDGYCGATPQPNPWTERWVDFYLDQRLRHQIELASKRGLSKQERAEFEDMLLPAEELLVDDEPPALIHGDLWSGNLHVAPSGTPALIDPAAYFGHREAELGMMALFGGFSSRTWDAYQESWPLREGWRERLDLYTLYHVLNHYNLFGGGYLQQALAIARRYL